MIGFIACVLHKLIGLYKFTGIFGKLTKIINKSISKHVLDVRIESTLNHRIDFIQYGHYSSTAVLYGFIIHRLNNVYNKLLFRRNSIHFLYFDL